MVIVFQRPPFHSLLLDLFLLNAYNVTKWLYFLLGGRVLAIFSALAESFKTRVYRYYRIITLLEMISTLLQRTLNLVSPLAFFLILITTN